MELHFSKVMRKQQQSQRKKNIHTKTETSVRQSMIPPLGMAAEDDPGFIGDVDCTIGTYVVALPAGGAARGAARCGALR